MCGWDKLAEGSESPHSREKANAVPRFDFGTASALPAPQSAQGGRDERRIDDDDAGREEDPDLSAQTRHGPGRRNRPDVYPRRLARMGDAHSLEPRMARLRRSLRAGRGANHRARSESGAS